LGREHFDFTIPYYEAKLVFLRKKSNPIISPEELSRRQIVYQFSVQLKKELEERIPGVELIAIERMDVAMEMLKAGHANYVWTDIFVAEVYCEKSPDLTYSVMDNFKTSKGIVIIVPKVEILC
jgi:ABC-type amino acid transport substrate-binding protein